MGGEALDADGSGTLGKFLINGDMEHGDMELTLKDKEDRVAAVPGFV